MEGASPDIKGLKFPQLQLQFFVVTVSFTAILGKLISVHSSVLVFWRTFLSAIILAGILALVKRGGKKLDGKTWLQALGIGVIIGLHWTTFFWAIHLSNVSVCLVGMASTSVFTAFSEALVNRRKPILSEVLLGLGVIPGLLIIIGSLEQGQIAGFVCALVSAFLASVFPGMNRLLVMRGTPVMKLTYVEMIGAAVTCALVAQFAFGKPIYEHFPVGVEWLHLGVLASICTVFAFSYHIHLLRYFSAFSVNLAVNFEPVYGIILAAVIFHEYKEVTPWFFIGAAVIVIVNIMHVKIEQRKLA